MQPPITTNQAAQEHRRLFSSRGKNAFVREADRKTRGSSRGKGKRIPTCTLKFFCLSQANAIKPPTAVKERTALLNAGLGDATIQFQMDSSTLECHQQIVSKFPKLLETGYELLLYQRGEDAGFYNIPSPYTPQRMRDTAGSSKIYLRPLQKDLDESPVEHCTELLKVISLILKFFSSILLYSEQKQRELESSDTI